MMSSIQNFIQTVQRMQWTDYLDIFVVAFLIYNLLPYLKTPKVKKIVRTVCALVLVAWLTGRQRQCHRGDPRHGRTRRDRTEHRRRLRQQASVR